MTIRNSETGEWFEVTVPDATTICEYDSALLDSIPYLLERARHGESWAYKALGDCYQYGKGGVEQSLFTALNYYDLSGTMGDVIEEKAREENPQDRLSLVCQIIGKMDREDNEGILSLVDSLNQLNYFEADILKSCINVADTLSFISVVERNLVSPAVSTDRAIFTLMGCMIGDVYPAGIKNNEEILEAFVTKCPWFGAELAAGFFNKSHEDLDSAQLAEKTEKAIRFLGNADKKAMLSRKGAEALYNYYLSQEKEGKKTCDKEELGRLAKLAKIPQEETILLDIVP